MHEAMGEGGGGGRGRHFEKWEVGGALPKCVYDHALQIKALVPCLPLLILPTLLHYILEEEERKAW